jgi:tRNA1Val (adenine37-N6)-methyltransferase
MLMANPYFQFKQFTIHHDRCAMKVTTDACLFGAWLSEEVGRRETGDGRTGVEVGKVLDIGTGTGLLSLMLAQKNPGLAIDAIEVDKGAAEQAKDNVDASAWKEQIAIINKDVKDVRLDKKYDYIISNPPFYENELHSPDQRKNTAHHSGGLTLSEVVTIVKDNLAPGGCFFLLLPYKRNEAIKDLLLQHQLAIRKMIFVRQSVKHDYFRIMLMGQGDNNRGGAEAQEVKSINVMETVIDELSITDGENKYTPAFTALLQSYYLHL